MLEDSSLRMTLHLSLNASYKYSISYYSDSLCRGGLWHFVALVVHSATATAELRAVLATHYNYIAQRVGGYNYVTRSERQDRACNRCGLRKQAAPEYRGQASNHARNN